MRRGVCKNILYNTAIEMVKNNNVVVIDVREPYEIGDKVIENSINIPVKQLVRRINDIVLDKNQPILVYCSSGSRSVFACQILAEQGYNKIYNLYGGIR